MQAIMDVGPLTTGTCWADVGLRVPRKSLGPLNEKQSGSARSRANERS